MNKRLSNVIREIVRFLRFVNFIKSLSQILCVRLNKIEKSLSGWFCRYAFALLSHSKNHILMYFLRLMYSFLCKLTYLVINTLVASDMQLSLE